MCEWHDTDEKSALRCGNYLIVDLSLANPILMETLKMRRSFAC